MSYSKKLSKLAQKYIEAGILYKNFENKYGDYKCGAAEDLEKLDRIFGQGHAENIKDRTFRELIDSDISSLLNDVIWSDCRKSELNTRLTR